MLNEIMQCDDNVKKLVYTPIRTYEYDRNLIHKRLLDFARSYSECVDVWIHHIDGGFVATINEYDYVIMVIENIIRINTNDIDANNIDKNTGHSRFFNINLKTGVICTNVKIWPSGLLYLTNDIYNILGIA